MVGSGVHGARPAVGAVDFAVARAGGAWTGDVADGKVKVIRDGRAGCYGGGALSARAVCVRARGGSLAEVRDEAIFRFLCGPCALIQPHCSAFPLFADESHHSSSSIP